MNQTDPGNMSSTAWYGLGELSKTRFQVFNIRAHVHLYIFCTTYQKVIVKVVSIGLDSAFVVLIINVLVS